MRQKTISIDDIEKEIEELLHKRDAFLTQANLEIASLNGRVAGLKALIAPPEEEKETDAETNET